jgi:hypothetical protein
MRRSVKSLGRENLVLSKPSFFTERMRPPSILAALFTLVVISPLHAQIVTRPTQQLYPGGPPSFPTARPSFPTAGSDPLGRPPFGPSFPMPGSMTAPGLAPNMPTIGVGPGGLSRPFDVPGLTPAIGVGPGGLIRGGPELPRSFDINGPSSVDRILEQYQPNQIRRPWDPTVPPNSLVVSPAQRMVPAVNPPLDLSSRPIPQVSPLISSPVASTDSSRSEFKGPPEWFTWGPFVAALVLGGVAALLWPKLAAGAR